MNFTIIKFFQTVSIVLENKRPPSKSKCTLDKQIERDQNDLGTFLKTIDKKVKFASLINYHYPDDCPYYTNFEPFLFDLGKEINPTSLDLSTLECIQQSNSRGHSQLSSIFSTAEVKKYLRKMSSSLMIKNKAFLSFKTIKQQQTFKLANDEYGVGHSLDHGVALLKQCYAIPFIFKGKYKDNEDMMMMMIQSYPALFRFPNREKLLDYRKSPFKSNHANEKRNSVSVKKAFLFNWDLNLDFKSHLSENPKKRRFDPSDHHHPCYHRTSKILIMDPKIPDTNKIIHENEIRHIIEDIQFDDGHHLFGSTMDYRRKMKSQRPSLFLVPDTAQLKREDYISYSNHMDQIKRQLQSYEHLEIKNSLKTDNGFTKKNLDESELLLFHMEYLNSLLLNDPKYSPCLSASSSSCSSPRSGCCESHQYSSSSHCSTGFHSSTSSLSNSLSPSLPMLKNAHNKSHWWSKSKTKNNPEKEEERFWQEIVSSYPQLNKNKLKSLSKYILKGIPNSLRSSVWPILCQSTTPLVSDNRNFDIKEEYRLLLLKSSPYERWISRDLARTFPNCEYFDSNLQTALYSLMKAYSIYDPQVGYCQGLSFIGGILLLYLPEDEAMGVLVRIMYTYGLRLNYTPDMEGLHLILYQFDHLFTIYFPKLAKHFNDQGVLSNMFVSQWFLTLFTYKLPFGLVFRIMDWFLAEGIPVLFRVAFGLLKIHQNDLLELEFDEILEYLNCKVQNFYENDLLAIEFLDKAQALNYLLHEEELKTFTVEENGIELNSKRNTPSLSSVFYGGNESHPSLEKCTFMGRLGPKGEELINEASKVRLHPKMLNKLKECYQKHLRKSQLIQEQTLEYCSIRKKDNNKYDRLSEAGVSELFGGMTLAEPKNDNSCYSLFIPKEILNLPNLASFTTVSLSSLTFEELYSRIQEYESLLYILTSHHSHLIGFIQYLVNDIINYRLLSNKYLFENQIRFLNERLESFDIEKVAHLEAESKSLDSKLKTIQEYSKTLEMDLALCKAKLGNENKEIENCYEHGDSIMTWDQWKQNWNATKDHHSKVLNTTQTSSHFSESKKGKLQT